MAMTAVVVTFTVGDGAAELRGHGGPVRAVAVAEDGRSAISGGFDQSVIVWTLESGAATEVLRFHDGAVNSVVALPDGRFASGGEDGRIAVWQRGRGSPAAVIAAHTAPIAGLAASADGHLLASGSWDETVLVIDLRDGSRRVFKGHQGNVNGVAISGDGRTVVSAGYDASVRLWPLDRARAPLAARLPTPVNGVAMARDGEILAAGSDGRVYALNPEGHVVRMLDAQPNPIAALALTRDGRLLAAAGLRGEVTLIERATGRIVRRLGEAGAPAWSVAFTRDGGTVLAGSGDRLIRRWNATDGEPIGSVAPASASAGAEVATGERGAQVFRACVACHSVSPDGGNRAGPTLHGVFGRRIATVPGYNYSEPLRRMDIVWTAETVSRLFEVGPNTYTPGTKMPEQVIGNAEDRAALIRYLERVATPR
jgi:cytochrome c